ncbi:MAG: FAD-binding protein, partial [Chryseolinea sp.]
MAILVFVESAEGKIKKTSLEALSYAQQMGSGPVTAIALGEVDIAELESLGKFGAGKVLHAADKKLNDGIIQAYTSVLAKAMQDENADILILANSSLGTPVAARVATKIGASLASNVVSLPDTSSGFTVKKSIYTGKAFAFVDLKNQKKVLALRKNAAVTKDAGSNVAVTPYPITLTDSDFVTQIISSEKATGEILLPEANIVVSGGRGMKGPENWGMLEDLAKVLHAATGCSKPVSD